MPLSPFGPFCSRLVYFLHWLCLAWHVGSQFPTRAGNYVPRSRVQSLNHWTTREVPVNTLVFLILLWKPNSSAHHSACQLQERRSRNKEPLQPEQKRSDSWPSLVLPAYFYISFCFLLPQQRNVNCNNSNNSLPLKCNFPCQAWNALPFAHSIPFDGLFSLVGFIMVQLLIHG